MFTVVLDACVLVPMPLADTLLRIAETGSVDIRWSPVILDEVHRTLIGALGIEPAAADRRIAMMRSAFPHAEVTGFQDLEPALTNDPKDRHVLAAAIRSRVDTIVTANLKDFPAPALEPWDVRAIGPDEFLLDQLDLMPGAVMTALQRQQAGLGDPPVTFDEMLGSLSRCGVPDFADEVRRHYRS